MTFAGMTDLLGTGGTHFIGYNPQRLRYNLNQPDIPFERAEVDDVVAEHMFEEH
jgi:hypothetical protein